MTTMVDNVRLSSETDFEFRNTIAGSVKRERRIHRGIDPSTGKELWGIETATSEDLDDAVAAAERAFQLWSGKTWEERGEIMAKMAAILREHEQEMTQILIKECGKPAQFAALEVYNSIKQLEFHATVPQPESKIIQDDSELRLTLSYLPIGVVGAICPWNFPLVIAMNKVAGGLITGNVVIAKPSPFTPYSILKFIEWTQPVLPAGVLQGIHGDDSLGPAMTLHPGIGKITFTGSTATGRRVAAAAGKTLKRVTLELGGNDACIVCPDVDIAAVAPQVALSAFFNSGQICVASKRVFIHSSIYEEFLAEMARTVKSWKVGPASVAGTMLGPVQNSMQFDIVKGYFDDCVEKGLKFAVGGKLEKGTGAGFVIQPAIIDNPPTDSKIMSTEPFGPIVPTQPWSDEDDVVARANSTDSGLGGSVWATDLAQANRLANRLQTGSVWINSLAKPIPQAYFSGHKSSGIGGELGREGLLSFCNARSVHCYKAGGKAPSKVSSQL